MTEFLRKTTIVGVTAMILCAVSGKEAHAQRTMRGESLVTTEVHYPFSSPYWLGADISYGQYLLSSYWKAGVFATQHTATFKDDTQMGYLHACAYGDWMYRLAGTRNRVFNLYTGAGAFIGYEAVDPKNLVDQQYKEDFGSGRFLYGVQLSVEMEVFFSRRVSLVLNAKTPFCISTAFGWFHYQVGAGLRVNI